MQEIWKPIKEFENHQEEIRARHKMRMETLEVEEVKNKIDKNLLGDF